MAKQLWHCLEIKTNKTHEDQRMEHKGRIIQKRATDLSHYNYQICVDHKKLTRKLIKCWLCGISVGYVDYVDYGIIRNVLKIRQDYPNKLRTAKTKDRIDNKAIGKGLIFQIEIFAPG